MRIDPEARSRIAPTGSDPSRGGRTINSRVASPGGRMWARGGEVWIEFQQSLQYAVGLLSQRCSLPRLRFHRVRTPSYPERAARPRSYISKDAANVIRRTVRAR